jgi:hypothetical protein
MDRSWPSLNYNPPDIYIYIFINCPFDLSRIWNLHFYSIWTELFFKQWSIPPIKWHLNSLNTKKDHD